MQINKLKIIFSISIMVITIALFQSCDQDESYDTITEEEVLNEYLSAGFKIVNSVNDVQNNSPKELKEVQAYLKEFRIDTTGISIECLPLTSSKIKTRSEGSDEIGTRYGVTITQEKTFLTHRIYITYTEKNDIYTIEHVAYEIMGLRLGDISTSAGHITQSSSTSSAFETTASYTVGIGSYDVYKEVVKYRWNIYFQGGSHISFSAYEF